MAKFTEIPFFILKDYIDNILPASIAGDSFTLTPIVLSISKSFELALKVKISSSSDFYNYKYVIFDAVTYDEDKITVQLAASESLDGDISTLENEDEVYIRKNTAIYNYVNRNIDYKPYVFFNKDHFYIGKIQKSKTERQYYIYIENLHKFVVRALPEHNRTTKLNEFLKLAFENSYQDIYNKQKNVLSLIDPIETNRDYLNYIANIYNVDINDTFLISEANLYTSRIFVKNLPQFLKRKGTYSSIFISSQFNTESSINVYERWHPEFIDPIPDVAFNPKPYFIDFDYLNYYSKETSGRCLKTRTVVDLTTVQDEISELNNSSISYKQIYPSSSWTFTHNFNKNGFIWQCYDMSFNKISPINTEFNDRTATFIFEDEESGYVFAIESDTTPLVLPTPADVASWQFNHGLNTLNPSDDLYKNIYPLTSYSTSDGITVSTISLSETISLSGGEAPLTDDILTFAHNDLTDELIAGAIQADFLYSQTEPSSAWTIIHNLETTELSVIAQFYISVPKKTFTIFHKLDSKKLIVQAYDTDGYLVTPIYMKIVNNYSIDFVFSLDFLGNIVISSIDETDTYGTSISMETLAISASIEHNLSNKFNLIQIYDENDEVINEQSCIPSTVDEFSLVFTEEVNTTINIIMPDYTEYVPVTSSIWSINHDLNVKNPLVQVYVPTAYNNLNVWIINHTFNSMNLFIQCFDNNNELLFPETIEIVNNDIVKIYFEEELSGYVHIIDTSIGTIPDAIVTEFENTYNYSLSNIYNASYKWFMPYEITLNLETLTLFLSSITDASSGDINVVSADWYKEEKDYADVWYGDVFYSNPGVYQFYSNILIEGSNRWNMPHNFGECLIFSWNKSKNLIPFSQITLSNTIASSGSNPYYQIDIDGLLDNEDGFIALSEGTKIEHIIASDTWDIIHGMNTDNIIPQFFNTKGELLNFSSLSLSGNNGLSVSFSEPASGYCLITQGNYIHSQTESLSAWTVEHNLNKNGILFAIYDDDGNYLFSDISLTNNNSLTATLLSENTGNLIVKGVDLPISQIYPETLELLPGGRFKATFENEITGYSVYTEVSQLYNLTKYNPYYIKHIDNNNTEISFDTEVKNGLVIIKTNDFSGQYIEKSIEPLSQTLYDGYLTATFNEEKTGYCIVKAVNLIEPNLELLMSPHYRVELDLSCKPYNDTFILPQEVIEMLLKSWEYVRPACKYAHYNLFIQPLADFTENLISLYTISIDNAFFYSRYVGFISSIESAITHTVIEEEETEEEEVLTYLHRQNTASNIWTIEHNLTENPLIQCFDNNREMILPNDIKIISKNIVKVYFDDNETGFALLYKETAEFSETYITSGYSWNENYSTTSSLSANKPPFVQIYDWKNSFILPIDVTHFSSSNTIVLDFDTKIKGFGTLTGYSMKVPLINNNEDVLQNDKIWTINHNLGFTGLIAQFYNGNNEEIIPNKYILNNINTCTIEFNEILVNAYVIFKNVGSIYTTESIIDSVELIENTGYIKFGIGTLGEIYDPNIGDLENPIIFNGSEVKTELLTIRQTTNYIYIKGICESKYEGPIFEMGIFDSNDNLLFYSYCSEIYKLSEIEFIVEYKISK